MARVMSSRYCYLQTPSRPAERPCCSARRAPARAGLLCAERGFVAAVGMVRRWAAALPGKPNRAIKRSGSIELIQKTILKNNGASDRHGSMLPEQHVEASAEEGEAGVVEGTKS